MRHRIACLAMLLGLAMPAQAQDAGFYAVKEARPPLMAYYGLGEQVADRCTDAIYWSTQTLYQQALADIAKTGKSAPAKLAGLGIILKSQGRAQPFVETAIMDRTWIIKARQSCGADPRVARLSPAALRERLAVYAKETEARASVCAPLIESAMYILRTESARLNAKGSTIDPFDVLMGLRVAEAAKEMDDDIGALCPSINHSGITADAGKLRTALEPLIPAMFVHPEFVRLLKDFTNAAGGAAKDINAAGSADVKVAAGCGVVLLTEWSLKQSGGFALAAYRAQKATPREKAAFVLAEGCWKTPKEARAAAEAFPST